MISNMQILVARISLSLLWIFTGFTSAFIAKDIGYEILARGGITGALAEVSILSGSILDVVIGLWLLLGWKLTACYLLQMVIVVTYTLLLTFIDPSYWLHPFGPITKNIPIMALVWMLYSFGMSESSKGKS